MASTIKDRDQDQKIFHSLEKAMSSTLALLLVLLMSKAIDLYIAYDTKYSIMGR